MARSSTGSIGINDYYDIRIKEARLKLLREHQAFTFHKVELADQAAVAAVFATHQPEYVVNLAAQAGVRHSLTHPRAYTDSNIVGFLHILEAAAITG